MRLLLLLALAFALRAQDTKPPATIEELTKQVTEQQKEIVNLRQQVAQIQNTAQELADAYQGCKVSRAQLAPQRQMDK